MAWCLVSDRTAIPLQSKKPGDRETTTAFIKIEVEAGNRNEMIDISNISDITGKTIFPAPGKYKIK